ncbi:MAG: M23 family metallopeptidase [Candidatus Promineifilaceae bacterium]
MADFKFYKWPTEFHAITQNFGANPQNYAQFGLPGHEGIDIRASTGSKVFCVAPGEVYQVHTNPSDHNYGIHVRVAHQDGYKTIYGHLEKALVKIGDQVDAGTILGLADNTGNSFGSHLHLTLKKDGAHYLNYPANIIDPTPFLLPLIGWQRPAGPYVGGWVMTTSIIQVNDLGQTNPGGATLQIGPNNNIVIPGGSIVIIVDKPRQGFTPVQVPKATLGMDNLELPTTPMPEPSPTLMTVDGWAWTEFLHLVDNQAVIDARYGINFHEESNSDSPVIGVLRALSTVSVLGEEENGYLPVRARQIDFIGKLHIPTQPLNESIQSLSDLPKDIYLGWVRTSFLQLDGEFAITRDLGTQLLSKPDDSADFVAIIKGKATVTIAGLGKNNHTPVLVHKDQVLNLITNLPEIELPTQLPGDQSPILPPTVSTYGTTPGWVFTTAVEVDNHIGTAGEKGLNLRDVPRRDGELVGFIAPQEKFLVMGEPWGEFIPIRIDKDKLQPPIEDSELDPDPSPLGNAQIGLHASTDPDISEDEHEEFRLLRPGIIKVLSFHSDTDIARLASTHPSASWIVRAFLSFGNRNISPSKFFEYTIDDVSRAVNELKGKDVVIELHNEPNITAEGLGESWKNGAEFAQWFLELLEQYRRVFPEARFIYPGLSPGTSVANIKTDHIQFIEASRKAINAADGLGVHLYWSKVHPMNRVLEVLDDYISRFREKDIWITEASNNKAGTTPEEKAFQYLDFWHELQKRPMVKGVTYFVASASDPKYSEEVWVGRGIGKLVGMR